VSYVASVKLSVSKVRCSVGHAILRELMNSLLFKGHAVAQLPETLRYKSEVRGLDFRWCY